METPQLPPVPWTVWDNQLLRPDHTPEGIFDQPYLSFSSGGLQTPDGPPHGKLQFTVPDQNAWNDWVSNQPILGSRDPDFVALQDSRSSPNRLAGNLSQTPDFWDWTLGDIEGVGNVSLSKPSQIRYIPPTNTDHTDQTNDENTPMDEGVSPNSSQAHGHLVSDLEISCQECGLRFTKKASLSLHTKRTRHSPYLCKCKATFSRLDVLDRHIQAYTSEASISCPYCQTNPKSFGRQDHLTQHLRGFHNMDIVKDLDYNQRIRPVRKLKKKIYCLHVDCWDLEDSEGSSSPLQRRRRSFQTQSHSRATSAKSTMKAYSLAPR
ncbi:hypothetical protein BKA61DRAFT_13825 [Leptodontidium sp. MPI-SDFR-AT-0119]|nr:hypothetical protein BKA61DRAFT_13825 [Leptodontidium sp. MPI-SDFR-AT-0119]